MTNTTNTKRLACGNFARQHLRECSAELIEWHETGLLRDGRVRELARMCATWAGDSDAMSVAERLVEREATAYCAANSTAPMAEPKLEPVNARLVEALKNVTSHLVAAHSLLKRGGKKAAASDTMFEMMLKDYERSFEIGRATLLAEARAAAGGKAY